MFVLQMYVQCNIPILSKGGNDRYPINKIDLYVFSSYHDAVLNKISYSTGGLHNILLVFRNSIYVNQAAPLSISSDIF